MDIPEWTKKIEYGITNDSYLLKTDEVLRVGVPKINKIIDRNNEIKILKLLEDNDLTVKILEYGFDTKNYFFLKTKYLPFTYNLVQQKLTKEKILQIFQTLKNFRSIPIENTDIKFFNWKSQLKLFKSNIKKSQFDLTEYEIDLIKIFKNYKCKNIVLSHNNLMPNNFLFNDDSDDKKVYLIDFEYSSLNDELYDVASFISETLIYEEDKKNRNELIKYWISLFNLNNDEKIMVKKWIFYQNILKALWANTMYDITKDKIFLKILEEKYHEIKKMY